MAVQPAQTTPARRVATLGIRGLVGAGLLVDAFVHLHLAPGYQEASPGGIGLGTVFTIQAVSASGAALYVLARGTRRAYAIAVVVAGAALLAVLLSRYVDLPVIGPLPAMYEPLWFPEKAISAAAEGAAAALAIIALTRKPARTTSAALT
jgi:hypothetical protein